MFNVFYCGKDLAVAIRIPPLFLYLSLQLYLQRSFTLVYKHRNRMATSRFLCSMIESIIEINNLIDTYHLTTLKDGEGERHRISTTLRKTN